MPRAFNQEEERQIRAQLRNGARKMFAASGVLKTSVEEIAQCASIAKGSFYKFYGSKEILYFELLEEAQNEIRAPFLDEKLTKPRRTRAQFEKLTRAMFKNISNEPLVLLMGRDNELLAVSRKVPPKILMVHKQADLEFIDALIKKWNAKRKPPSREAVAAHITMLLLISLKRDFLGEHLLPHAVDAAISNLADCLFSRARS